MAANGVNLDALIPRADLAVGDGVVAGEQGSKEVTCTHLMEHDFFAQFLRKPEFQRETVHWTPNKILELVTAFLDRRLIPAVILWRSGQFNFVVDGAHRISALMSWMYNDYGDGVRSRALFGPHIPPEQETLARKTRELIDKNIGQFHQYQTDMKFPHLITDDTKLKRMSNLSVAFFVAQWVPSTTAKAAEESFFTINDAATPLDKTEKRILVSRDSAAAISSRAIAHEGSGYPYWSQFPETTKKIIVETSADIYKALYRPALPEGPVDTLDVPVAGRGYSVLPFVFDLVNQVNNTKVADSTAAKSKDKLDPDPDGNITVKYLKTTWKTVSRITTKEPTSLGLHPVVYFYTRGGAFSPWAFLAWASIINEVFKSDTATAFCDVRDQLEKYLVAHKWAMTEIIHKNGSGTRSIPWLERYWSQVLRSFISGMSYEDVVNGMATDEHFSQISVKSTTIRMAAADRPAAKGKIAVATRTAALWDAALPGAPRCPYCHGYWHRNSFHGDHVVARRDGGSHAQSNVAIAHPYCDSAYKDVKAGRATVLTDAS